MNGLKEQLEKDADDTVLGWISNYTKIPIDGPAYRVLVRKCVYLVLRYIGWKHLDLEKPDDAELCLVYMEEHDFGWQLARYSEKLDDFFGQFHGYHPRWWMRLTKPREII